MIDALKAVLAVGQDKSLACSKAQRSGTTLSRPLIIPTCTKDAKMVARIWTLKLVVNDNSSPQLRLIYQKKLREEESSCSVLI